MGSDCTLRTEQRKTKQDNRRGVALGREQRRREENLVGYTRRQFREKNFCACIILEENQGYAERRNRIGQARKSARGMPWHQEPKKDVTSCEKPRVAANKR